MEYGGPYPVSNIKRDWTKDWREWQYQHYQEHLSEEDEDEARDAVEDLNIRIREEQ